jgi:hypothetical protein
MQVRYGLTCKGTIVNPNVEAIRLELCRDLCMCGTKQAEKGYALCVRDLKKRANVTPWDDEAMARRDWEAIPNPDRVLVLSGNTIRG